MVLSAHGTLCRSHSSLRLCGHGPIFLKAKYPSRRGVAGHAAIHLRLMIDKQGIPRDVQVVSGVNPELDRQAIQIVSGWRFQPGQKDGKPVDVPANLDLVLGGSANRAIIHSGPPRLP